MIVYKIATKKNVNIRQFRELLATKLLGLPEDTQINSYSQRGRYNIAVRKNASGISIICACKLCYSNKRRHAARSKARENVNKTTTFCPNCPDQPQLYIESFKILHSK
ncbi:hypothetical protein ANTQUA_LOCUS5784 [Anthophora quadrimaculata]